MTKIKIQCNAPVDYLNLLVTNIKFPHFFPQFFLPHTEKTKSHYNNSKFKVCYLVKAWFRKMTVNNKLVKCGNAEATEMSLSCLLGQLKNYLEK